MSKAFIILILSFFLLNFTSNQKDFLSNEELGNEKIVKVGLLMKIIYVFLQKIDKTKKIHVRSK